MQDDHRPGPGSPHSLWQAEEVPGGQLKIFSLFLSYKLEMNLKRNI